MDEEGTSCDTHSSVSAGKLQVLGQVLLFSSFQISHISDQYVN